MQVKSIRVLVRMPMTMTENSANSQRQVNGAPKISFNRVAVASEEHEEMNKMAHDVPETLRY